MKHYGLEISEGSEVVNLTAPTGTAFPAMENPGEFFFRTDEDKVYVHGNSTWIDLTGLGTPGGSNTQIQFNDSGSFGASASFTITDTATADVTLTGTLPTLILDETGAGVDEGKWGIRGSSSSYLDFIALSDDETISNSFLRAYRGTGTDVAYIRALDQIQGVDGSGSAPTYAFSSDTDMGMYQSSTDVLGFSTSGTERLTVSDTLVTVKGHTLHITSAGGSPIAIYINEGKGDTSVGSDIRFVNNGMITAAQNMFLGIKSSGAAGSHAWQFITNNDKFPGASVPFLITEFGAISASRDDIVGGSPSTTADIRISGSGPTGTPYVDYGSTNEIIDTVRLWNNTDEITPFLMNLLCNGVTANDTIDIAITGSPIEPAITITGEGPMIEMFNTSATISHSLNFKDASEKLLGQIAFFPSSDELVIRHTDSAGTSSDGDIVIGPDQHGGTTTEITATVPIFLGAGAPTEDLHASTKKYVDDSVTGHNPAGANTEIQFNDGGSTFGASANLTWDGDNLDVIAGGSPQLAITTTGAVEVVGQIRGSNGSAVSPTFSFINDLDSGMFLTASNTLGFSLSGNTHADITTSAGSVRLFSGPTNDHVRLELYSDSAAQTTRTGYFGYVSAGGEILSIVNEYTDADTQIITGGGDLIVNVGSSGTGGVIRTVAGGSPFTEYESRVIDDDDIPNKKYVDDITQHKNLVINGNFNVWQRGTSFTSVANLAYTTDRVVWVFAGGGVIDVDRSTTVPNQASEYSVKATVTTADASLAAGDAYLFSHHIEGHDAQALGYGDASAKTATVSFLVRSSVTGIYGVSFRNSLVNRSYVSEYTINSANTWEYKTVTITGDTSGTWGKTNGIGTTLAFTLASGSTFHTTAGDWQAGNYITTSNQVNFMATATNAFYLSQVQVELGEIATDFDHRPISETIRRCQRYYCKTYEIDVAPGTASSTGFVGGRQPGTANYVRDWQYPVNMRGTPTVTAYSHSTGTSGKGRDLNAAADVNATFQNTNSTTTNFIVTGGASADGNWVACQITADAEL